MATIEAVLHDLMGRDWARLCAVLVASTRRLDLAEDALADAFEQAARRWPEQGVPDNPPAWLLTTARRRVIDRIRAEAIHAVKHRQLASSAAEPAAVADLALADADADVLRLVLLAAHPSLSGEAGAALTLRLVLGVSTADIARLFLVSESTMAARITRAKKKVILAGIPLALPEPELLDERLELVAQIAYLVFTAGYAPGTGDQVVRVDHAERGIALVRLVRSVSDHAREHPALIALEALMMLQHSRRDARCDSAGGLVLLADQDRRRWHHEEISQATALLDGLVGERASFATSSALAASYLLQALIAAEQVSPDGPSWQRDAGFYAQLEQLTDSDVVRVNRAVSLAQLGDLDAAAALLEGCGEAVRAGHRYWAVLAKVRELASDQRGSRQALDEAIARCGHGPERALLLARRQPGGNVDESVR